MSGTPSTLRPISRRSLLKGATALAGGVMLAASPFRALPGRAASVAPGEMLAMAGTPNPAGAFDQLYWLAGDALSQPIAAIRAEGDGALPSEAMNGSARQVRVLHFNDLHNRLTDQHNKKGDTHRFSQMYAHIAETRQKAGKDDIVLLFSGGDDHTGSVFDELVGWSPEEYVADPGYHTYSAAGLDAAAMGNHELDRGAKVLKTALHDAARFPVLSANLFGSAHMTSGADYFPAAIGVAKGVRVGLIGLTTMVDTHTKTEEDPTLDVASPVKAVTNLLPALAEATDMVVILSHCGYGIEGGRSGKAGADRYLAEGDIAVAKAAASLTDKPVLVIGGHTHTVLNADGLEDRNLIEGKVPVVQAGGHGSHIGEVSFTLSAAGRDALDARLYPVKKRDDRVAAGDDKYAGLEHDGDYDAGFEAATIAPLLAKLEGALKAVIAEVSDGEGLTTDKVVAERYIRECAIGNFMNDAVIDRSATFPGGTVDIALINASGLASGIPASGPLSFQEWYNVMPFADSVMIFELTGRQLRDILVSNAKRVVRPHELEGADAVDVKGYVSRGFLHFSRGVRYTLALNGSAAEATALNISLMGEPIETVLDKTFRVAINSYVGAGAYGESWNGNPIGAGVKGGIASFDIKSLPRHDTGLVYRNEIIARIKEIGTISPRVGAALDGRLTIA